MLVTGGSGSVGRVVAAQALAAGWTVVVHGRSAESAAAAVAALGGGFPEGCDLLDDDAIPALIARIPAAHGRLDAVAHCAVSAPPGVTGPFAATDPAVYTALCHHAITTLQWLCHAAFPVMAGGGGGALVAVASDAGRFAAPNQSLIATSRAGIMAFVRNVAQDVARERIRVNCVSASYVEDSTIMRTLEAAGNTRIAAARKRAGLGLPTADDLANLILFLLGSCSTHITGQVISVNGGLNS